MLRDKDETAKRKLRWRPSLSRETENAEKTEKDKVSGCNWCSGDKRQGRQPGGKIIRL